MLSAMVSVDLPLFRATARTARSRGARRGARLHEMHDDHRREMGAMLARRGRWRPYAELEQFYETELLPLAGSPCRRAARLPREPLDDRRVIAARAPRSRPAQAPAPVGRTAQAGTTWSTDGGPGNE